MSDQFKRREREISRQIHRLFWEANFIHKGAIIFTMAMRIPALFLFYVLIPLQVAYGIEAIVTRQFEAIDTIALTILLLSIAYAALWSIGGYVICKSGASSSVYLQQRIFGNFLQKDYDFYSNTYFGALGAQAIRIRDAFSEYNILALVALPKQTIIVVAGIVVIGINSPWLALITLLAMAAVLSFTMYSSKWRMKYRRQVSEAGSEIAGIIGDALTQAPAVKSFAAENYESQRLQPPLLRWSKAQFASWASSLPADAGRAILAAVAMVILLVMTARMYQDGNISIAIVALIQLYVIRLISTTQEIAEMIKAYEHAMGGSYQPVKTMLVTPVVIDKPKPKHLPAKPKMSITFQDVTFRYPEASKTVHAISNFSLQIKPGEKVGLVGFSGSGKTTLTKLLLRFMDVTGGSISVADLDIRDVTQKDLRSHIAYVPQEPLLFHRSIFDNIAYGQPQASTAAVHTAAKMAHIDDFIAELPKGYDTLVGERGVKLSGGQRQRVAIARAILKNAPILVLDEATSALDSQSEQYIQEALWNLMKDRTAVVIAHRLSTIQRLDKIVVMDKGRIVQAGTHQALLKDKQGVYAKLWAHQSGGYITDPNANQTS